MERMKQRDPERWTEISEIRGRQEVEPEMVFEGSEDPDLERQGKLFAGNWGLGFTRGWWIFGFLWGGGGRSSRIYFFIFFKFLILFKMFS